MSDYWKKKLEELERENQKAPSVSTPASYWEQKMDELENEKKSTVTMPSLKNPMKEDEDDIAPVKSDSGLDFFQKGVFADGYQFGDVTKAILGTAGDVGLNVVKGAVGLVEGVVDLGGYAVSGAADLVGADSFAKRLKSVTQKSQTDQLFKGAEDYLNQYSMLGKTSDAIMQGVGQVGSIIATGGIGAAAGLGTAGTTALTTGLMGLSGMGSGMGEAYQNNATDLEALKHGLNTGAADAVSELIFGGLGKAVNAVGLSKGLSSADDMLAKLIGSKFKHQAAKNIVEFGIKSGAEGLEEVIAGVAQAYSKYNTYLKDQGVDFIDVLKDENLLEQFLVGSVTSGIAQAPSLHIANTSKTDFITGQTQNEQAVIKKEIENRIAEAEKNGKKLTAKEKANIEAQVEKDMEKGYISTDTIEEVLGGEAYQRYKETVDSENALAEQQKALQEEFDTLNKMKQGEMTGEQIDRRAELKEELAKLKETIQSTQNNSNRSMLKQQLSESVSEMVRSDRLIESYNERSRRGQAFEADLSKYDKKYHATIQKAVDSGILNNTNRTHEFVDMVAKISADKGVLFDFTNNEKLKESGFAVDGKTVNGYVTKDGITLNMDSSKAWQSTVGHEITHVLEGTEFYTELQKAVMDYAKAKNDYQGRYDSLTKLYESVEGADINKELTADLVGDYLFTDADFINNLSTNHRNVFQKIYDEVKYLLKVATAGSKEARELEKVKRAFDKAYRADSKPSTETDADVAQESPTQYSVSVTDPETIDFLENQEHITTYKAMVLIDGKLYPPMASKVKGEDGKYRMTNPRELGEWQQATEDTANIKFNDKGIGYYDLKKDDGGTVKAAYNPYEHSSNLVLNDQFEAAYKRDNLVTVECEIPVSELTSGYKAEHAKDSTGMMDWHSGVVAGKLKDNKRKVYLSRYLKAVRILSDAETAAKYKEIVGDTPVPFNVVSPGLLAELEKIGVNIDYDGSPQYQYLQRKAAEREAKKAEKVKYSLSTDSDGNKLTEEQAEYFKKSKMRDDAGNLKPMYHGSQNGGFHVFDPGYSDDSTSFFFVDRNTVATSYSGTSETYAARSFKTAEDFNKFFAEIGAEDYEVREEDGKFQLYEDGDFAAESDTAEGIYEEFRDWSGKGYGNVNYKVYLNLENPYIFDAKGAEWNGLPNIQGEDAKYEYIKLLSYNPDNNTYTIEYAMTGDSAPQTKDVVLFADFDDGVSTQLEMLGLGEELRDVPAKPNTTRDYAEYARKNGYDGVILKNIVDVGGYGGDYAPATVAIAFDSNQIKSVANTQPTGDPDIRYSLSDSNGKKLSAEQSEYFKDSKAVDENGNLKVVYHGSPKDFNTFSLKYLGTNGTAEGYGFYFTDKKRIAEGYSRGYEGQQNGEPGKLFEVYLDIKKPLSNTEVTMTRAQFKKFLIELNNYVDADGERLDVLSNYGDVEWEGLNKVLNYAMEAEYDGSDNDVNLVHSIINGCGDIKAVFDVLRKTVGYDGIIVDEASWGGDQTIYIAFHPEQIKNVDNLKPTSNPDIRYSLSDVTEEQNEHGLDAKSEVQFSLSNDTAYMDKAIAKNNSSLLVDRNAMNAAKVLREKIAARMTDIKDRGLVGLPEDIEGNTYIANSSYDGTEENTTICPRSLASEAFVDAVSEYLGRPLTVDEQIYISQDLQGRSLTPECTYCYVATDRKAYRAFLGEYISQRDAVLQQVQENPNADVSRNGELYKEFLNGRKDTNPMYSRFKMWVDAYKNGKPMVDASHLANINKLMGDINSEFGAELKPQIVDAMKYAQSASWAKKRINYVAYNGHILNWKQDRINKLNSHYGLRMYSFSDFHPAFVLENMQMITDASVRGLKMLGYTKDTDFVDIFAPTGMNINVSTFGFESGGNVYENNIIGAEWAKAKALREQYPNVGVTFVATNDHLVNWALDQDWIDVVIPYHLVRTGAEVAKAFGYTNYTSESSDTKTKEWSKGDKKYIAPTEHNNDKATYLAALEKNHLNPRFERFIENPNYMKLVNECRQPASMSKPVQPVFNEDAAMVALAKLEANGYYQPIGGSVERMYEIAAEVAEDMTSQIAPDSRQSLSFEDEDYEVYGNYSTPARDLRLEIAPVKESLTTAEESTVAEAAPEVAISEKETTTEELFPDDLVPGAEDDADTQTRLASLDESDMPPEMEAPYLGEPSAPADPFAERNIEDVGNRSVKAYMYENPEVKPFFQAEANIMLGELRDTVKGERIYQEDGSWTGTSRHTSDDIAYLRDSLGYSYAEIEKGLNAIIEDNGKENIAVAKRIEFILNDRLGKGYTDFNTGMEIPADQDYINLVNEKRISEYSEEAFARFMETADLYAPPADDIAPLAAPVAQTPAPAAFAPVKEEYVAVTPKSKRKKEPKMVRADKPFDQKTANILANEPKVEKKKNGLWSMVKENILDNGMVFEDLALKTKNRDLQAKWNFIRYAQSMAQRMVGKGTENVKSLDSIRQEVEKSGKVQEFYEYLYHWLNVDRMTLENRYDDTPNKAVFGDTVTADMSRVIAVQLGKKNPEFRRWAQDVYRYNSHLRTMMVNNGVISQETADLWQEMYPHYVPIRRVDTKGLNIDVPLDTGRTGVNAPIKRATGGNSDILPLFDTMAQRTMQTYKAIAKNSFGVELKNTLGTTITKEQTDIDGVIDSMDNHEGLLQEGKKGKKPTFTVFENGEKVTFEITDEMYNAMKPASDLMSYTNPVTNTVSNLHRGLLTEYNPVFMATNAIKDTQDILINSQHPVKTYANLPRATLQIAKNGKWFREYMEHGGEDNTYFDGENNSFDTEEKGVRKLLGIPPLSWISKANNFIERTPRLAEYIASREAGRSIEVSMLDAARVTTNFAAGGKLTKLANRNGATFLNASVQGVVQQARNFREAKANGLKGWAQLAGKFALAGLPALLLNNLMWDDDDEYEELSDYVKQNYYIVGKYGDGKFVRIPKGRTLAIIQNAFEQMENAITGDDGVDLKSFLELVVSNLAPNNPVEDNILAPIIQVANNETWYGEDLVPTRLQDLPAAEQFDESTDAISKWLGEKLNFSPYKINYLLDQYSGGIGDTFLPMMTPEAESGDNTFFGNVLAPAKSKFTTDSVMNNQNVSDFYDLRDELTTKAKSSKATDEDKLMSKYINSVNSELSELYAQKREWQNSGLPADAKYKKVRDIQQQIVDLMKEGMSNYQNVSYEDEYARIGDRLYTKNDEGEWQKLSDEQVTKYEVTKAAGDAPYATDGTNHYRWYEPGEDAGSDAEPGWRKVTEKELERQNEVTRGLGITPEEYWGNKDEYTYAFDNPESYAVAKAVGGYDAYRQYSADLSDISADKDKYGKSISGSRKVKVTEYINSLDADYYTKLILYKSEYTSYDDENYEIIEYLNSRDDISFEEEIAILRKLGFDVTADGNISW